VRYFRASAGGILVGADKQRPPNGRPLPIDALAKTNGLAGVDHKASRNIQTMQRIGNRFRGSWWVFRAF
jgi:hypothetical protein